ncbi:MAG: hypothetical protein ACRCYO_09310 [Bacteroidia bacterium]
MHHLYIRFGLILVLFLPNWAIGQNRQWVRTTQKVALFEHKNDFEISFNYSDAGVEGHTAYALTDHWALSVTGVYRGKFRVDTTILLSSNGLRYQQVENGTSFRDLEFAGGYSTVINDWFCFEVYGGIGFATQKNIWNRVNYIRYTDYVKIVEARTSRVGISNRYFIQPAIGRNSRYVDYGFAFRISMLDYKDFTNDILCEPSCFIRAGYKNIKAMAQVGLQQTLDDSNYNYSNIVVGAGLYFQWNQRIKKRSDV